MDGLGKNQVFDLSWSQPLVLSNKVPSFKNVSLRSTTGYQLSLAASSMFRMSTLSSFRIGREVGFLTSQAVQWSSTAG